jgi:hypothetical protein
MLDVSSVDWIINAVRRLLLIIYLPCSLFLYVTFRFTCASLRFLRTLHHARSLFYLLLTSIVCTNSVSLSLCHPHSLLTMIVAILCIYPCLITKHVMYGSLLIHICACLSLSLLSLSLSLSFALSPSLRSIRSSHTLTIYGI